MTTPLITVEDLGLFLRRSLTGDAAAGIAVEAANAIVFAEVGELEFTSADDLLIDGSGTDALLLPFIPVSRVRYVGLVDPAGGPDEELEEESEWRLGDGGILYKMPMTFAWPNGRARVHVIYDHGFQMIEPASGEPDFAERVPSSLRLVALSIAARVYAAGVVGVGGVQSETMGKYSYTLSSTAGGSAGDLTTVERLVLSRFRTRRPVWYRRLSTGSGSGSGSGS